MPADYAVQLTVPAFNLPSSLHGIAMAMAIPSLGIGGPVTVELWAKVDSGRTQTAFTLTALDNPNRAQAHLPYLDNQIHWQYGNSVDEINADYTPNLGKWTHVALVSGGSGGAYKAIYLNALLSASASLPGAPGSKTPGLVGANTGISEGTIGAFDDFRVWDTVRTQQQIRDNMFRSLVGSETGLALYYKLDERSLSTAQSGQSINDASPGSNTGTISGPNPSWVDRPMDITSDVVRVGWHKARGNLFTQMAVPQADILVENWNADYSPENPQAKYWGNLRPNVGLQITATYSVAGVANSYALFTGYIDAYDLDPMLDRRVAHLKASGKTKDMIRKVVNLPIAVNVNPGSLVTDILSAALVMGSVVDSVSDTIPYA